LFSLILADSLPIGISTRFLENGVFRNYGFSNRAAGELAENPTLQELAVSNHRRDVPVA
jgi:hypothetical protein